MIRLLGSMEGSEGEAARALRQSILETWPWAEDDPGTKIHIVAGVKCHGQPVRDLDLVVLGQFSGRARYVQFLPFFNTRNNSLIKLNATVIVRSLCLIIEVKDSGSENVRFVGTQVEVQYDQGWKNVTEQSHKQIFALKNYLLHHRVAAPHITNLIWLRNIENADLPRRPHNILGGNATWDLFLNVIGQESRPRFGDGIWTVGTRPSDQPEIFESACDVLTKIVQPTHLDRVKMDRICRAAVNKGWMDFLGSKHLIFQGRGGTGKTVILLRLAWKAYEERRERVLILTYNKALVADLRRLFTLMNLPDSLGESTIQIQTIHAFLYSALRGLGFDYKEVPFLQNYEEYKERALSYIREGAVTASDIERLVAGVTFRWDYVFVDEAQDWPENERELLRRFYPNTKFVVADGVDQFVRHETACDWRAGLTPQEVHTIKLTRCLRMKAGLAMFVTQLATALGLGQWNIVPNTDAPGGRVIIVEGDYFADSDFHDQLIRYNEADGNYPVDMLACVPPSLVASDGAGGVTASVPANILAGRGQDVWDGVSEDIRTGYPTSVKQLRIVQYDSCRGLEGWVVINFGLDAFYEYKKSMWQPPAAAAPGVFADDPSLPHLFAARWVMIPMTRAIDTLVIQIGTQASHVRDALAKAAEACSDFVVWVRR